MIIRTEKGIELYVLKIQKIHRSSKQSLFLPRTSYSIKTMRPKNKFEQT